MLYQAFSSREKAWLREATLCLAQGGGAAVILVSVLTPERVKVLYAVHDTLIAVVAVEQGNGLALVRRDVVSVSLQKLILSLSPIMSLVMRGRSAEKLLTSRRGK